MIISNNIIGTIIYILSLQGILVSIIYWLNTARDTAQGWVALLVSLFGLIIAYYTTKGLIEQLRIKRLERAIKEIELKKLQKEDEQK